MEVFGYKYIHKLPQFITTLHSRRNSSIDMRPNTVNNCNFMSILCSKPLRECKKLTSKTGDRVQISKHDALSQRLQATIYTINFWNCSICNNKPPRYTIKNEQNENIQGKFYLKSWLKSFNNEIVYNRVGF